MTRQVPCHRNPRPRCASVNRQGRGDDGPKRRL